MAEATREQALKDFRYIDSHEAVIEAFQITEHTVFADKTWPPWLRMQQGKNDMNCVYRITEDPQSLFINMNGTEGQIGFNAWILRSTDDSLSVMGEFEFEAAYNKVVPVPDKPPMVATDGKTDQEFYDGLDEKTREKFNLKNPRDRKTGRPAQAPADSDLVLREPAVEAGTEILELRTAMLDAIGFLKPAQSKAATKASLRLEVGLETAHEGGLKWCECRPGTCDESSKWGCRKTSPLL